ncbi:hypothetical protein GCM10023258_20030 [Terrabacter aeriphilus]|uniref:DUF2785 domain-containing protein n=1 Tax=Terrabacter aeriphilus TaxID=515662 RepID=A0ABP9JAW6_9MICO
MPDTTLAALVDDLASPDPAVRDEHAYAALTRLVRAGAVGPGDLPWLVSTMLERLGDERTEVRTFAPLVLAALVEAGDANGVDPAEVARDWVPAVARWYVGEADLRGHDPQLGWLHAVAHGADFFGACGSAGVGEAEPLLDALAQRLVAPTPFVWRDQEDDRLACALALVLARPGLGADAATGWLGPVRALFATGAPGAVPAEASNTMRTLRSLHVALGEQVLRSGEPVPVEHAALVRTEVAAVLAEVTPWFWAPLPR